MFRVQPVVIRIPVDLVYGTMVKWDNIVLIQHHVFHMQEYWRHIRTNVHVAIADPIHGNPANNAKTSEKNKHTLNTLGFLSTIE